MQKDNIPIVTTLHCSILYQWHLCNHNPNTVITPNCETLLARILQFVIAITIVCAFTVPTVKRAQFNLTRQCLCALTREATGCQRGGRLST